MSWHPNCIRSFLQASSTSTRPLRTASDLPEPLPQWLLLLRWGLELSEPRNTRYEPRLPPGEGLLPQLQEAFNTRLAMPLGSSLPVETYPAPLRL